GDETEKLPPIPQPCPGAPAPAAVLLDTAIIQSSDVASNSYGINLLSALSVYATGARSVSNVFGSAAERGGTDGTTSTRSFSLNLGSSPTTNYITYALDIANSVRSTNEVISQPTLVALDRLPSTFFSGAVVTLGVTGNNNSSSTIEDKPIGISLSITPTVIDKDTLNLNVKVARSALSTTSLGTANTFNQALSTTRTTVSASVTARYGQTILVSGLTETGNVNSDNGTPILKDIPALQWLFDRQTEAQFRTSILVAITPRKVDSAGPNKVIDAIRDPQVRSRLRRLFDKLGEESSIRLALQRLSTARFFELTKDGDFEADRWHERSRLQRLLDDAERMIRR
ncbi:MAG: type II secretion system protein GspD, partial [Alphaproteobacteria bacterium]